MSTPLCFINEEFAIGLQSISISKTALSRYFEPGDDVLEDRQRDSIKKYFSTRISSRSIDAQVSYLKKFFHDFHTVDKSFVAHKLPFDATGYLVVPRWEKLATTYNDAVQKVLSIVSFKYRNSFCNHREEQLASQYLQQCSRTVKKLQQLEKMQEGYDFLVIPYRLDFCCQALSVKRMRNEMALNEFGIGAFHIGIMMLTHPEHFHCPDNYWIDCVGDGIDTYGYGYGDGPLSDDLLLLEAPYFHIAGSSQNSEKNVEKPSSVNFGTASTQYGNGPLNDDLLLEAPYLHITGSSQNSKKNVEKPSSVNFGTASTQYGACGSLDNGGYLEKQEMARKDLERLPDTMEPRRTIWSDSERWSPYIMKPSWWDSLLSFFGF